MARTTAVAATLAAPITSWTARSPSAPRDHPPPQPRFANSASLTLPSYASIDTNPPLKVRSSPERRTSADRIVLLNCVPEDGDSMEFDNEELAFITPRYSGGAPLGYQNEDEGELELDEELEKRGLYRGSYRRLIALYAFSPLTTVLAFTTLALVPTFFYHNYHAAPIPYPYAPYLPFPLPELLTASAFWSISYLLRDPLYTLASSLLTPFHPSLTTILSSLLHTTTSILIRLFCIPILLIPHFAAATDHPEWHDAAFRRVWWVALGWAAAEAAVGIKQGYEGIALYKDVMVTVRRTTPDEESQHQQRHNHEHEHEHEYEHEHDEQEQNRTKGVLYPASTIYQSPIAESASERQPLLPQTTKNVSEEQEMLIRNALEREVEHDLDQLIALKNREELEEVYGVPVIRIPVFLSCLHRINSLLGELGMFLLLSAAYMRSTFAIFAPTPSSPSQSSSILRTAHPHPPSNRPLFLTLSVLLLIQLLFSLMHTPLVLPRMGVPAFVYVSLLISLGMFFAGLGVWEALS